MSQPVSMLAARIEAAFRHRSKPEEVLPAQYPDTFEYAEAQLYRGKERREITAAFLAETGSAFAFLDGTAFAYYLPAVLLADMQSECICADGLIICLDRSPTPEYWDDYFLERWPRLDDRELEAVKGWILWLSARGGDRYSEDSLMRAFETLELLQRQRVGQAAVDPALP